MRLFLLALIYILGPSTVFASASGLYCDGETYSFGGQGPYGGYPTQLVRLEKSGVSVIEDWNKVRQAYSAKALSKNVVEINIQDEARKINIQINWIRTPIKVANYYHEQETVAVLKDLNTRKIELLNCLYVN